MKINIKQVTKISIVAAIYVVCTMAIAPIGYGAIQFRVSEILNLLAFFNPIYGVSLVIGCGIANIFSPYGLYDLFFGTLSTLLSVIFIMKSKNLFIASLWPSLFIPLLVGIEITILTNMPFLVTAFPILISEFIIMTLIGYPVFKILSKNSRFISILEK